MKGESRITNEDQNDEGLEEEEEDELDDQIIEESTEGEETIVFNINTQDKL